MSALRLFSAALSVSVMGVALAGCKPAEANDPRVGERLVQLATVEAASASKRAFTGIVAAKVQSNLGFRVGGKITQRLVDTGQTVKLGQPLMRIDQTDLDLAITTRTKAVAAARALQIQAAADEQRYRELREKGWSTQQRYEQARAALDTASAQVAAAEAQEQVARNESGYSTLLADADGVVVETLSEPGQVVSAGQVVVRLAHSGSREAAVNLPETLRPELGSNAEASLYGDRLVVPAKLRQLSDAADARTRTYEARYVLEGEGTQAPIGATVTVRVAMNGNRANIVPLGAIADEGKGALVWIVDRDSRTVTARPVQVIEITASAAIVGEGVKPGETIVATGGHYLHEGEKVRFAEQKAAMQ